MAYNVLKGNVQFINSDSGSIESMVDDYSDQTIGGIKTFSGIMTASVGLTSSTFVSASSFHGDGAGLTYVIAVLRSQLQVTSLPQLMFQEPLFMVPL